MSATTPRLLVVTPTLGLSEWLDETVASVAALPLRVTHMLAAPANRLRELAQRFPRARVVADQGKSGGIYGALNAALLHAPHDWDWFTYINDDDSLLPGCAEIFAKHIRGRSSEPVIYGDVNLVDERGHLISRITVERSPAWIPALLQEGISPLMQQGLLFRRDVMRRIGGFDLRYRLCADLDFWLRAFVTGARFKYYASRVAQFRLRAGQLSGSTTTTEREQAEIVRRNLPKPTPGWLRRCARWRYRLLNLPRYFGRIRARGWRTSYELLQGEEVQS